MNIEEFLDKLTMAAVQYPLRTRGSYIYHLDEHGRCISPISVVYRTMFPHGPWWSMADFANGDEIGLSSNLKFDIVAASDNVYVSDDPAKVKAQKALRERILIAGNVTHVTGRNAPIGGKMN